jgi:hypothetical protein
MRNGSHLNPDLCNHASPSNHVHFEPFASLLFEQLDRCEKAIEMLVDAVIPALKPLVAGGQICGQGRRIVVLQGRGIRVEFSVFVVREASDFLTASATDGSAGWHAPWAVSRAGFSRQSAGRAPPRNGASRSLFLHAALMGDQNRSNKLRSPNGGQGWVGGSPRVKLDNTRRDVPAQSKSGGLAQTALLHLFASGNLRHSLGSQHYRRSRNYSERKFAATIAHRLGLCADHTRCSVSGNRPPVPGKSDFNIRETGTQGNR